MPTYAIGDIQGCFKPFQALLKKIEFNPEQDRLWLVGDLINRGPESLNTLDWIYEHRAAIQCVLGNHDLHLLAVFAGSTPLRKTDTFKELLESPKASILCHWLREQPLLHYDAKLNVLMMHAGLYPLWDLKTAQRLAAEVNAQLSGEQYKDLLDQLYGDEPDLWHEDLHGMDRWRFIINAFTRMRLLSGTAKLELNYKGNIEQSPQGFLPWFKFPLNIAENTRLVFGHWAQLSLPLPYGRFIFLDSGCVWGRALTAIRLEDEKVFSVTGS